MLKTYAETENDAGAADADNISSGRVYVVGCERTLAGLFMWHCTELNIRVSCPRDLTTSKAWPLKPMLASNKRGVAMHVLKMDGVVGSASDIQLLSMNVRIVKTNYPRTLTMTLLWGKTMVCSLGPKSSSVVALWAKILSSVGRSGERYYTALSLVPHTTTAK
jgi:hypothetical protein